ncbi:MAG: O-antigen ligase family protein [Flavobacteriales bacterium]
MREGFSIGLGFCLIPFVLLILFHLLDLAYKGEYTSVVNKNFRLCLLAILSVDVSVLLGLYYQSPILNPWNSALLIGMFSLPYLASVVVQVYNREDLEFDMSRLFLKGLGLFLAVNLLGYGAGLRNLLHSFAGRVSLPFTMGIYDGAHILAFMNLLMLGYMKDFRGRPMRFMFMLGIFVMNLGLMLSINSRLSFMVFMAIAVLFVTRAARAARGLYAISLFTMPLLTSFALLIYAILSQPIFTTILDRVSKKDVTTFNGRTYIWEAALDWVMDDRRGLIFGNGYNGQYHLRMLEGVAKLWNESGSYRLHMHSAFLEVFVNQGLVGLFLMYAILWRGYQYYRKEYLDNTTLAPMFAGFAYLMFAWQIDIFGYGFYAGFLLLMMMMAPASVKPYKFEA